MKKIAVVFAFLFLAVGCKKEADLGPQGSVLVYTFYDDAKFDSIDVFVNGEPVGSLTKPYDGVVSPSCDTQKAGAIVRLQKPAGKYPFEAYRMLNGKKVGTWDGTLSFVADGECRKVRLQ